MMRPPLQQILQQNSQDSSSSKDPITLSIEKNACGLCRAFKLPKCKGHGGGSGGGGSGGGQSGGHSSNVDSSPKSISAVDLSTSSPTSSNNDENAKPLISSNRENEFSVNNKTFDITVINDLLDRQILSIENDSEHGVLYIQCHPVFHAALSEQEKEELNNFFNLIQEEFNEFKNNNPLSANDILTLGKDNQGNIFSLRLNITNPDLYDKFIEQLTNHFRATPVARRMNELQEENTDNTQRPNPFAIDKGPPLK